MKLRGARSLKVVLCFSVVGAVAGACSRKETAPETPSAAASSPHVETAAPAESAPPSPPAASSSASPVASCQDLIGGGAIKRPFPPGYAIKGIDASTDVAWSSARDLGIRFAFLQASLGADRNRAFAHNWSMAKTCGIPRGAYHLMSPKADADKQSELFAASLTDPGDLPPVVDVELVPGCRGPCCEIDCAGWQALTAKVLARVEEKAGIRPLLYTVEPFWKECLCNTSRFAERTLWLAGFPRFDAALRPGFGGFQRWAFYQSAGNAKLGAGVVDLDVFRGEEDDFRKLLSVPATR